MQRKEHSVFCSLNLARLTTSFSWSTVMFSVFTPVQMAPMHLRVNNVLDRYLTASLPRF